MDDVEALAVFNDKVRPPVWYDLADGDAIASSMYTLCFDADQKAKAGQLVAAIGDFLIAETKIGVTEVDKCRRGSGDLNFLRPPQELKETKHSC